VLHRIVSRLLASAILTLVMVPACAAEKGDVAAILAANRDATGAFAAGTVTVHGRYSGQGLQGITETVFDSASGRYVDRYDLPPTSGASGFDGDVAWQTDLSGASTPQQGGDRPALGINNAYRHANRWWREDFGGARIESLGRDADGDRLRVAPPGGKAFEAWFDPATHLLARVREVQSFATTIDVRYRDYARIEGVMVPRTTTIDNGSGEAALQTVTLDRIARGPAQPASAYAMPQAKPGDWRIDDPSGQAVLPMRLYNNHIFVDVIVDGKGPFPFLVDTGGHDIVTPQTAKALALDARGEATSGGGGEKTVTAGYTRIKSLQMGKARLDDQTVLVLDFSPKKVEGFQVGGMLGVEVFERFVVRIDYGAGTFTLVDPKRFDGRDAGTPLPFVFYDHMPQVEGRFAGIPARFDIDTGSRAEVTMARPFVEKHRLRERFPQGVVTVDGWGVGGPVRSHVIRSPSLALGDVSVDDVTASLATQDKGVFTDEQFDGNIGSAWLKRFVVTFDYPGRTMYLDPVADPGDDVGTFDRSGMWLNLGEQGFVVAEVAEGGPAARAGLRAKDVVVGIDGKPVSGMLLPDARKLLRTTAAGTRVVVAYRRGDARREATLTLRDQIPAEASPPVER
jgi:hypothetical protein